MFDNEVVATCKRGDAVQRDGYGAYDLHQAVPLKRSDDGHTFSVTTQLKGNKYFKFTNGTDWATCTSFNAEISGYKFNNSNHSTTVNLLINGSNDYKFMVAEDGMYTITIDLSTLRLHVEKYSASGIGDTTCQRTDPDSPHSTVYDLQGRKTKGGRGIHIIRQGHQTVKVHK